MTPAQRKYLDALQEMLQEGAPSTVTWRVCERAGVAAGTHSAWKKAHKLALSTGSESVHQDFWDEERAIRQAHRDNAVAERALEPEIMLPELEEEPIPEVLVAYLAIYEEKLDRLEAWQALSEAGWQVSFDDVLDAASGGHKAATRRFNQLRRRTTIRLEDKLRRAALNGTRSQDNSLALQVLRVDDPEKWNPKAKVVHEFQLEEGDRKLIEEQRDWYKGHVRKIPASTGTL